VAISAAPCGAAGLVPALQKAKGCEEAQAMLGYKKVSCRTQEEVPGMGISMRRFMLVYHRNHLRRQGPKELEKENEVVQEM
jgi:hypothetical protein